MPVNFSSPASQDMKRNPFSFLFFQGGGEDLLLGTSLFHAFSLSPSQPSGVLSPLPPQVEKNGNDVWSANLPR